MPDDAYSFVSMKLPGGDQRSARGRAGQPFHPGRRFPAGLPRCRSAGLQHTVLRRQPPPGIAPNQRVQVRWGAGGHDDTVPGSATRVVSKPCQQGR